MTFWDGRKGVQIHRRNAHSGDVPACCAVEDDEGGAEVLTGGIDGQVCRWARAKRRRGTSEAPWVILGTHKSHTHDVLAVAAGWLPGLRRGRKTLSAMVGSQHPSFSTTDEDRIAGRVDEGKYIILSGGLDVRLGVVEGREVGRAEPFLMSPFPLLRSIRVDSSSSLLVNLTPRQLELWEVPAHDADSVYNSNSDSSALRARKRQRTVMSVSATVPDEKPRAWLRIRQKVLSSFSSSFSPSLPSISLLFVLLFLFFFSTFFFLPLSPLLRSSAPLLL